MTTPELLEEAVEAHGGRERWAGVETLRAKVRSGGLLMRTKLKARHFAGYRLEVRTGEQRAALEPYPGPGRRGVFAGDTVRIESEAGETLEERDHVREGFFGLSGLGRKLRWSDLDALYFAGYAMWNYLTAPFLFERPGFGLREGDPIEHEDETWRRLDVSFPDGFHTHCREQSYYFGPDGLLRRHDYSPDVVSPHANAAHFSWAHERFDGLVFPTSRRVVPKGPGGRPLGGPTIVSIELESVEAR